MKDCFISRITAYVSKYLSTRVVFALDLITSTLCSVFLLIPADHLVGSGVVDNKFVFIWIFGSFIASALSLLLVKCYKIIIRYSTVKDFARYPLYVFDKELLLVLAVVVFHGHSHFAKFMWLIVADFLITLFITIGLRLLMIVLYDVFKTKLLERQKRRRLIIYGTSQKSVAVIQRLADSTHYEVVAFITGENIPKNLKISNLKVYSVSTEERFAHMVTYLGASGLLFTTEDDAKLEQERLILYASHLDVKVFMTPSLNELEGENLLRYRIREIRIEDLLGREEITCSMDEIRHRFSGRTVLVTGAAGSIGSEICFQLAGIGIGNLVIFDNAETPVHNLRLSLQDKFPGLRFSPIIGDVRSKRRLDYVFRTFRPDIVFHAAAYKHVPLMEENPCEAVRVNVVGSKNVADGCLEYGVGLMVMISTDKAVNPTNIMGCSKRLAEIYVQSLGLALENGKIKGNTKFVTTRFGNVLGSNGSVIPLFRQQIERGGPVTVTDPRINRFFMTIPEACRLVLEASIISKGNQIVVFDMGKPVKIDDLAHRMIELAGFVPNKDIMITYSGLRPGEKLYEEVLSNNENTDPTRHDRIRVARVRQYDYEEVNNVVEQLSDYALKVDIVNMVRLMKAVVPEFKSKNSPYEQYDVEFEQRQTQ